jgi:hypothetical protein
MPEPVLTHCARPGLLAQVRAIAEAMDAPWLLE